MHQSHLRRFAYYLNCKATHPPTRKSKDLVEYKFHPKHINYPTAFTPAIVSPSRCLSNLFWESINWDHFSGKVDGFRVIDLGCGSGAYSSYFSELVRYERYVGYDISPRDSWSEISEKNANVTFRACDLSREALDFDFSPNLFVSQSALEHFANDLFVLGQIADHLKKSRTPGINIHLLPSPVCLNLYGLHGFRQYGYGAIERIVDLFQGFSQCVLFHLGGKACNALHRSYVADHRFGLFNLSQDSRAIDLKTYERKMKEAILTDQSDRVPNIKNTNFLALCILSNLEDSNQLLLT